MGSALGCKWMQDCGSGPAAHRGVSGQQVMDSTVKCGVFGRSVEVAVNEKLKYQQFKLVSKFQQFKTSLGHCY